MRRAWNGYGLILAVVLSGCAEAPQPPSGASYVAEIEEFREGRVERLRSSWLMLAGLFWLEPGDNTFGSDPGNMIVFPEGSSPGRAGSFVYTNGSVTLVPEGAPGMTIEGEPVELATKLGTGEDTQEILLGRLTFYVIERSGQHAIRLRDPESPAVVSFTGIEFYPTDESWVVEGRLVPYDEPRIVSVETVIGHDAEMTSVGRVEFDLDGGVHSLEALKSSADATELFLIFKDETSGRETYGAGRYLYAPLDGRRARIDFNRAYNPPCAFTPYATCPLPPRENRLELRVEAGERKYAGPH
jgi:uncharacterized protein (DUF1684 family)